MKKTTVLIGLMALGTLSIANASEINQFYPNTSIKIESLTGDSKTACEVILCLSASSKPSECSAPLKKYYSLKAKKWHKTVAKRKKFLQLCPASSDQNIDINALANK